MTASARRPIGRYLPSKHRKSLTSLKLGVDTSLRQLTRIVTLTPPTLTLNPNFFCTDNAQLTVECFTIKVRSGSADVCDGSFRAARLRGRCTGMC